MTTTDRRHGLIGLLVTLMLLLAGGASLPTAAHAAPDDPRAACLAEGKVWVYAIYEDSQVVADTCVSKFSTGTEALESAGVKLTQDSKGFICSMSGHPATCPKTFNGQYWAYYQSKNGRSYTYATTGADQSHPQPGTIEAWCYNKPGTKSCVPPVLDIAGAPSASPAKGAVTPTTTAAPATPQGSEASAQSSEGAQQGSATSQPSAAASSSDQASASAPASASSSPSPAPASDSSDSSKGPWGIVIALVVVAAVIAGIVIARRRKADNSN